MRGFGLEVSVVLDRPAADLAGATAHQAATLEAMDMEFSSEPEDGPHDVVVDGLIGSGSAHDPHVYPDVTVTLALPKTGLGLGGAGRLLLADIGIPPVLYSRHLGIEDLTVFSQGDIVDVTRASLRPVP